MNPIANPAANLNVGGRGRGIRAGRVPKEHRNVGLNWQKAINRHRMVLNQCARLKRNCLSLDRGLHQRHRGDDNGDDGDDDEKKENLFYDDSFTFYVAQIVRIEGALSEWKRKSDSNVAVLNELEFKYHSKYRPLMLKQLTASSYNALSDAANGFGAFVPDDIIGIIWMFTRPFDALVELKFVVDAINEFFESGKRRIARNKLPIQSHRGYETAHYL